MGVGVGMSKLVTSVIVQRNMQRDEYEFIINISTMALDELSFHRWLGRRFPKKKSEWIEDVASTLAEEIADRLSKVEER